MHYFLTWRMLMKCVIPSPRHSSESQGSAFQPKWSLYAIAIDHGLIVNSEEKLENETVFVRQQKHITNNQISTNTRNRVNNLKKTAKEHFEQNLDTLILENISNPKTYWKIMKMLIKSNKGYSNIPPLQNIIQDEGLEEVVYEDDEKCELLNKYFSFISSLEDANIPLPDIEHKTNNFLRDIVITTDEIVDIIKILNHNTR